MLGLCFVWGLVGWAQPADTAVCFFSGAFGIEVNQVLQDFFVGEGGWPAVGGKNGVIQIVVELFEDGDEALFVDLFFFRTENLRGLRDL